MRFHPPRINIHKIIKPTCNWFQYVHEFFFDLQTRMEYLTLHNHILIFDEFNFEKNIKYEKSRVFNVRFALARLKNIRCSLLRHGTLHGE